jgi:hypothetical protein
MDDRKFDSLTKALASGHSRRSILKGLLGLGGGAVAAAVAGEEADAQFGCSFGRVRCGTTCCAFGQICCGTTCCASTQCNTAPTPDVCCGPGTKPCGTTCYNTTTQKCCGARSVRPSRRAPTGWPIIAARPHKPVDRSAVRPSLSVVATSAVR